VACTNLGNAYRYGLGVAKDESRARELLRRGCDGDCAWGCYNLAAMLEATGGAPSGGPSALSLYQKACRLGHARACRTVTEWSSGPPLLDEPPGPGFGTTEGRSTP
jgi:TPR repeat protein